MTPKDVSVLIPGVCEHIHHAAEGFCRCGEIKDLEMGDITWIIQVGPVSSHKSLEVGNLA